MIRLIYTFFVGLFLAIFIGMGISVFYPGPVAPREPAVMQSIGKEGPTASQQQEINAFNAQVAQYDRQQKRHNQYVSMMVLIAAVIILAIALSLGSRLGAIADGVLLGGVFTLLYGIGVGMATEGSKYRFLVAAVGLAATITLGYLKFARTRLEHPQKPDIRTAINVS